MTPTGSSGTRWDPRGRLMEALTEVVMPRARDARAGPGLRTRRVVDLPAPRAGRAGLGHRPLVRRIRAAGPHPRRGRRGRRVPAALRRPTAALRRAVLRRDRQHRLVRLLRHRRPVPGLRHRVPPAGRTDRNRGAGSARGDRRRRAARDRPVGTGSSAASTRQWWRTHWAKTGRVRVDHADAIEDGWRTGCASTGSASITSTDGGRTPPATRSRC